MLDTLQKPQPLHQWVAEALANPDPQWLLPGFIPAQGLVIIAGRPKLAKKSWFAYAAAMSMASGRTAGPFSPSRRVPVLFYSREGAPGPIANRFLLLEKGMGISISQCDNLYWVQNGGVFLDEPNHVKQICKTIEELKIECTFWDTFARSFRGDENKAKDVGAALRGVEKLRDAGSASVLVHHLGKSEKPTLGGTPDPDAGLRGSSALAGAYDNIVNIQQLEIDGASESWAIVGGKYLDFHAYRQEWEIDESVARILLDGPQELPVIDAPQQRVRF